MKKIIFTIIAICLTVIGIKAQPIITYAGNASQIGDSYEFSGANGSFDPGPAGANQSWDFSTITPTIFNSVDVVSPGSTPFASDFPESNTAYHYTGDNELYSYGEENTTERLHDGVGFNTGDFIHYTDPVKSMEFPFSYTDSYIDSYYTSYTMSNVETHEHGNVTVTADAWGSVSTPAGVYNNTLRVKSEYTYTDSMFIMGNFISATTGSYTDYDWYMATSHTSVISISVTADGTSVSYRSDGVGIDEQTSSLSHIHLYPNPATDKIDIEFTKPLENCTGIFVYNAKGKQVALFTKTVNRYTADISSLSPGIYFVTAGNSYAGKFIKQ